MAAGGDGAAVAGGAFEATLPRLIEIPRLGPASVPSPLEEGTVFVDDSQLVLVDPTATRSSSDSAPSSPSPTTTDDAAAAGGGGGGRGRGAAAGGGGGGGGGDGSGGADSEHAGGEVATVNAERGGDDFVELAGPRSKVYFDASSIRVGLVTCGGLCPGMNDVVRAAVQALWHTYGVRNIVGFRYGFEGLNPATSASIDLTPDVVKDIGRFGGTMLGSSRGPQDVSVMVEFLRDRQIDVLLAIGGDGTLRGVNEICREIRRRKLSIAVVGIPKTIDNDVRYTQRTFGFETAVNRAQIALTSAKAEARSQRSCVGLVKVMGRESGFVALHAALASPDVNLLLIPEVPFTLERVMEHIEERLQNRGHCLVLVAEGAGQDLMERASKEFDKSGNRKLGDIGTFLRDAIGAHFKKTTIDAQVKYIDPSYTIRSAPATAGDSIFCQNLAHMAVHAALAGKTNMVVGMMNGKFVHLPVERVILGNKKVAVSDVMYQLALDVTGTPRNLMS